MLNDVVHLGFLVALLFFFFIVLLCWPLPRGLEGKSHPITTNTAITSETGAVAETFGGPATLTPVDDINGSPLSEVRRMALE